MIKALSLSESNVKFGAKQDSKDDGKTSKILPNTLETRVRQKYDKTASAVIEYPKKGLTGDVNSDFYEFLSMGIIPYIAGSAMFMGLFNLVNKHLSPNSRKAASNFGNKMALGVVLYGLGKTLSGDWVTRPVYWGTGVDIELPYKNVSFPLPTEPGAQADIYPIHQQRKIYDSREFFRKDLIASDPNYGTQYYANIAKKLGMGENLNDPATETSQIIQSIVSTTKTAKSLSTYAWAGLGVGLAVQNSWGDFFDAISKRRRHIPKQGEGFASKMSNRMKNFGNNCVDLTKTFGKSFGKACKTLWTGEAGAKGFKKYAGKSWILFTAALTAGSVANVIYRARQMGKLVNKDIIEKDKESTVI